MGKLRSLWRRFRITKRKRKNKIKDIDRITLVIDDEPEAQNVAVSPKIAVKEHVADRIVDVEPAVQEQETMNMSMSDIKEEPIRITSPHEQHCSLSDSELKEPTAFEPTCADSELSPSTAGITAEISTVDDNEEDTATFSADAISASQTIEMPTESTEEMKTSFEETYESNLSIERKPSRSHSMEVLLMKAERINLAITQSSNANSDEISKHDVIESEPVQLITDCRQNLESACLDELLLLSSSSNDVGKHVLSSSKTKEIADSVELDVEPRTAQAEFEHVLPAPTEISNASMDKSEDAALRTIIKYTESSPIVSHKQTTKEDMLVPKVADLLTPRISKLETMVEKVVVNNGRLMENFQRFMDQYNIETTDNTSLVSAATTSSMERMDDYYFPETEDTPVKHEKRKRSQSARSHRFAERATSQKPRGRACSLRQEIDSRRKAQNKYRADRGPKLSTRERAIHRRAFDVDTARRIEREMKDESRRIKQLQEMERQIRRERSRLSRYKAHPIRKYKRTEIVLPRRKLRPKKVAIYDRAMQSKREKEEYLAEFRRLRDLKLGISEQLDDYGPEESFSSECDLKMRCNGNESRLKVMQSLKLRQS